MGLSLREIRSISEIAKLLYPFLPATPHPFADQSISFKGIAYELGLEEFWQGGSKLPCYYKITGENFGISTGTILPVDLRSS